MGLFTLLHESLGITLANLVSTSAGMAFSFTVNGIFVFGTGLGWRRAARFVATTGATMWVLQPVLIHLLLFLGPAPVAKLVATGITVVVNFLVYRFVVWRPEGDPRATREVGTPALDERRQTLP